MKSFVVCISVVMVCYRPNVLEKSIGYLGTALLIVLSWYLGILSSCLVSGVGASVENWRALKSHIYLRNAPRGWDCASLLLIGCS